jgi:hypothetical protein
VNFNDIKEHFGSVEKAKVALGLKSRQTLYNWREGGVPPGWQARIQIMTEGVLKADEESPAAPESRAAA